MDASVTSMRGSVFLADRSFSSVPSRMWTCLRLLWLEIRRSQGFWLLPFVFGFGIYAPSADQRDLVVLWRNMSLAALESFLIPASASAVLAAWLVGRDRRRRTDDLVSTLPGSGVGRDLLSAFTAAWWGLAGYVGITLWFFGRAVRSGAWGGPDPGLILTGAFGIVAMALMGALVGRLAPGRLSPLVALATCWFLLLGLDSYATSGQDGQQIYPLQLLSPYGLARRAGEVDGVFARHAQSMVPQSLVWLGALSASLVFALVVLRNRHWMNGVGLVLAVVAVTLSARPLVQAAEKGFSFDQLEAISYLPVCDDSGSVRICLHPAYASVLPRTVEDLSEVLGPVAGLDGVPHTLVQRGTLPVVLNPGEAVVEGVGHPTAIFEVVGQLFPAPEETDGQYQHAASQIVIQAWLAERSAKEIVDISVLEMFGFPAEVPQVWIEDEGSRWSLPADAGQAETVRVAMEAALSRFSGLSELERRAWLEANWEALRSGEIGLEELP